MVIIIFGIWMSFNSNICLPYVVIMIEQVQDSVHRGCLSLANLRAVSTQANNR